MKKQLLTIMAMGAMSSMFAQLPVSTAPQNKKAVLEEFTGIYCGYCPDGHKIATNIYNADPTRVLLINIHSGGYANVNTGEADFKTTVGNAIDPMPGMGITGYPSGNMNRTVLTGTPMAGSRSLWSGWKTTIVGQTAYCNIALQGTINAVTRVLTAEVAVYYTANAPVGTNSLNVMLLENDIPGKQVDYGNYNPTNWNPDGTYKHNHVLRASLTGNFGITIPVTTAGTTYTTTLTYTIPATYGAIGKTTQALLGRLELIGFVNETDRKAINAAKGPLTINNFANTLDIGATNLTATDGKMVTDAAVCSAKLNGSFKFNNYGSTTVTSAVFSYNVNGGTPQTYTWTGSAAPMTMCQTINLPTYNFSPVASNTLNISVVSVNGTTDQNSANNNWTATIPLTTVVANTVAMTMDFTQDRYGSEVGWVVYDENTMVAVPGAQVTFGTYPDLTANGTLLHTHTFVINPATCYKLMVTDQYGDGVNAGYGVGGYSLKSGVAAIITGNGQYGPGENKWYQSSITSGLATQALNISGISVYPNPASTSANVNIEMAQNENVNIVIINSLGQTVYSEAVSLNAGSNDIKLNTENWASGIYNVNFTTSKGSATHKLTINK